MQAETPADGFEQALRSIPSCALDGEARRLQQARYEQIAKTITTVVREPDAVRVEFNQAVSAATIHDLVAAEHDCCPFLNLDWENCTRQLSVTVASATMLPALDALEAAFTRARGRAA